MTNDVDKCADVMLLRQTPLFDASWYLQTYQDVQELGLDPVSHYLEIGADLGRDPSPFFSTQHYLTANPDIANAGLNPLVHFLRSGFAEGRSSLPGRPSGLLETVLRMRHLLFSCGLTEAPYAAFLHLSQQSDDPNSAGLAMETLGFWHLHQGAYQEALNWFTKRIDLHFTPDIATRLFGVIARCCTALRDLTPALNLLEAIEKTSPFEVSYDSALAALCLTQQPQEKITWLNTLYQHHKFQGISLLPSSSDTAFLDRLNATPDTKACALNGPKVSVILAAFNAQHTIATALRSLSAQVWKNLEILVVDDASSDQTTKIIRQFQAKDPRIHLIQSAQNIGAYRCRNLGLAKASGTYVTLMDADDWAHPERISRQVAQLHGSSRYIANMSRQARVDPAFTCFASDGEGRLSIENLSSLLVPRTVIEQCLGGWDTVRAAADSELLRRVRHLFGHNAVELIEGPALSFSRASHTSATAQTTTGMSWFYYGARLEYYQSQLFHHKTAKTVFYDGKSRPFAVSSILQSKEKHHSELRVDTVLAGAFYADVPSIEWAERFIQDHIAAQKPLGLLPLYLMDSLEITPSPLPDRIRKYIDGHQVRVLVHGETVHASHLEYLPSQPPFEPHRYLPIIKIKGELVSIP